MGDLGDDPGDYPGDMRIAGKLQGLIDAKEDRLVACTLDATAARRRATAGDTMRCCEEARWYVV
jgi:hypothetical protein